MEDLQIESKLIKLSKQVQDALESEKIYANVSYTTIPAVIMVEITLGDWKKDHIAAKNLIKDKFDLVCARTDEEANGDDAYTATHYFFCSYRHLDNINA